MRLLLKDSLIIKAAERTHDSSQYMYRCEIAFNVMQPRSAWDRSIGLCPQTPTLLRCSQAVRVAKKPRELRTRERSPRSVRSDTRLPPGRASALPAGPFPQQVSAGPRGGRGREAARGGAAAARRKGRGSALPSPPPPSERWGRRVSARRCGRRCGGTRWAPSCAAVCSPPRCRATGGTRCSGPSRAATAAPTPPPRTSRRW